MGRDAEAAEQQTPESFIGRTLGTCTIERVLGRGGMGVVFLAHQSRPNREVAVKVLLLSLMPDPARRSRFLARFRREADAVAMLDHSNILPIYEYGEQPDLAYLVMPYVSGGTLRDRVERKGQLPLDEAAGFLSKAAVALDYAHNHGVIHRDVKPQNMLLYPDKRLVLSDFGIAKVAQAAADEDGQPASALTTMGHVVGTPDYIAPEQAMGHPVDGRADIYSLGVVLFYMVTGRVPFIAAQPMTVAAKHVSEPPPPPRQFRPDLPPAAEAVILRALAKDPAQRYRSAGELARAFRAALPASGQVATAAPRPSAPPATLPAAPPRVPTVKPEQRPGAAPPARVSGPPPRRRGWLPVVLALLAILLASVGAYAAVREIEGNRPITTPTASATSKPTATHTATATATSTATPSPTSTTPAPTLYTASQFVPTQGDLPGNTTPLSPVTATTPDQFNQSNSGRVVNPTQGYNWQEDISEQIDKSGSKYLFVAIDQFATAADATKYFNAVVPHLKQTQQQQIGDQEIDGLCCDNLPTNYNVFYREHNVTVIILVDPQNSSQANQDAVALAKKIDQHVRPSSALLQVDRFALNRRDESNARNAGV